MSSERNEWTRATGAAFAALADTRPVDAAERWMSVLRGLPEDGASVPLWAAARNNAGFARMLVGAPRDALHDFEQAAVLWVSAREFLDTAELGIPGRSSVFHLRLAMNDPDAFEAIARRRLERLCVAAATISHANARLMRGEGTHSATLSVMMSEAFGPRGASTIILGHGREASQDARIMGAYAEYRTTAERLAGATASSALDGSDYGGDLEHAANLTALVHPMFAPSADLEKEHAKQ
jgi:hypothetical protein